MQHAYPHSFYRHRPPVDASARAAEARIRELVRPSVGPFFAGAIAGMAAGASVGIWAGPISALVGVVIGAFVGGSSGLAVEYVDTRTRLHDDRLDRDIGVYGGDIGAMFALRHPEPTIGAYSSATAGYVGSEGGRTPAEGPFAEPE